MLDQTYSQEFEVQQIIDEKIIDGETHFLVKWIGYGHEENTWEPMRHMTNSKDKIKQWEKYKLKQLSLLQNYKLLEDLDLQTDKNKINSQANAEFIEAAKKSSTPYKKLKPVVILDINDKQDEPQDGKITSLFDRPEVKKIIKRRKVETKKKDLEIFQQRLKSRPKVWEKYIQNEDQAIKLANQKIKEVVDQVFGSKINNHEKPPEQDNKKEEILIKRSRPKKEKSKILQIFSDSDELEITKGPQKKKEKILPLEQSLKKVHSKNDNSDSDSSMDESTNFISKKQAPFQISNQSQKTGQMKIQSASFKVNSPKNQKQPEVKEKLTLFFPKKNLLIQPETILLDTNMIKRLENKEPASFETSDSSSSNSLESQCGEQSLQKKSSSFSSRDSKKKFKKIDDNLIREKSIPKYQEDGQEAQSDQKNQNLQKIIEQKQESQKLEKAIKLNAKLEQKKKFTKSTIPLSSDSSNQEYQVTQKNAFAKTSISKTSNSEIIKQEEPQRSQQNFQQENQNYKNENESCQNQQIQNVKFEWTVVKKAIENEEYPKVQNGQLTHKKMKFKIENGLNNKITFVPFECSISTIEGAETSDEFDQSSKTYRDQSKSIKERQSSLNESQSLKNLERVINYSSLTNHRSTALPSQDSGESYHIFTTQNAFQQNFLQNRSLSTRASFNTHKTEIEQSNSNFEPNQNLGYHINENQLQNQEQSKKIPYNIFSSQSSSEIIEKLNFSQMKSESQKQNINKSLSLEHLLQKINGKSSYLQNIEKALQNDCQNLFQKKTLNKQASIEHEKLQKSISLQPQMMEKSIENPSENQSEQSSKIILDFNKIGSENQGKFCKKTSKKNQVIILNTIPVGQNGQNSLKIKDTPTHSSKDTSQFHQMFILENNLPQDFA